MQRPSGTAAVRLSLLMLLFAAFAMSLVQPAAAGTEDAPEVADPSGDAETAAGTPACAPVAGCVGAPQFIDVTFGWVNESATEIQLNVQVSGNENANVYGSADFDFAFTIAGTAYVAGFHVAIANLQGGLPGDGAVSPTGVATAAAYGDAVMTVTVPKSAIGNPAGGSVLSGLTITSHLDFTELNEAFTDATGPGLDFVFAGGSGGGGVAGDSDGDGLNDTCEQTYFGNLTATDNATEDPDGDGLTNGQECALGTDPTKADTDGDGVNDKDDPFPLDPTQGGSSNTTTSSSSSSTSRSSSSSSTSGSASISTSSGGGGGADDSAGTCADQDTSDAVDCLTSDIGYIGMSAGGFLAVLVLCIIALATRWSL
jgi:hypothetical protein